MFAHVAFSMAGNDQELVRQQEDAQVAGIAFGALDSNLKSGITGIEFITGGVKIKVQSAYEIAAQIIMINAAATLMHMAVARLREKPQD